MRGLRLDKRKSSVQRMFQAQARDGRGCCICREEKAKN